MTTEHTNEAPVKIEQRLLHRINVREWGMPSMVCPGKIWRSEKYGTISCMIANGPDHVRTETRQLEIIPIGEMSWMPDEWRAALWEYVQAWPSSGCGYGPFLALTENQRCDFLRKMGKELVESDNIGCRHIASDIGLLAACEYETIELEEPTK